MQAADLVKRNRWELHQICGTTAMNWVVMLLRNGVPCRAQCTNWGAPWFCCSSDPWRASTVSVGTFGPPQTRSQVDAEIKVKSGSNVLTQRLRDLELVKYGRTCRDDIHDKVEEAGRIDLVFKAKSRGERPTMLYLLFRKPKDATTFADGDWYNSFSGVELAPIIALGLKEFCKYYVTPLANAHEAEQKKEKQTHSDWMEFMRLEIRRQIVHSAQVKAYSERTQDHEVSNNIMEATQKYTVKAHRTKKPKRFELPMGVLHDFPVSDVKIYGSSWTCLYDQPYWHETTDEMLELPPEAKHVLVAAKNGANADVLALAAFGRKEEVFRQTHTVTPGGWDGGKTTSPNCHNGAYWYRWPGHSFGFSGDPELFLYYVDAGCANGIVERKPQDRLSWSLGGKLLDSRSGAGGAQSAIVHGWRAGENTKLDMQRKKNQWRKMIFYSTDERVNCED